MLSLRSTTFVLAAGLFFVSGALGLGYELVWIRKAALVVGASQIALSTVLTAFFLGLGLGSLFVGSRLGTRGRSPLFVYGLFEAAIGLFALAFPWLFEALEAAYGTLYPFLQGSSMGLFALRFVLLFLLFLPPTFFMGGTLPLLLAGLVDRDQSIGSRASLLYGINILGAVVGVLLTCYLAIPAIGMNGTSIAGGAGNLAIAVAALIAFRRLAPIHADEPRAPAGRFFASAAFASGLLAIGYQVAWARYFSLFKTGTVYLTAVLLAVYLLALAAGSFIVAPLLAARWRPLRILSAVQALVPIAVLYGLEGWRAVELRASIRGVRAPDGRIVANDALELDPMNPKYWRWISETADAVLVAPFLEVGASIFIPVVLIGCGLPCILAAAAKRSSELRSISGRLLFWNTLGASAGGFAAGYVLLPFLGLHGALVALSLASLGLSAAARFQDAARAEPVQRASWTAFIVPAAGLLAVLWFAAFTENIATRTVKLFGYGRDVGYNPDLPPGTQKMPLQDLVEGPLTTSFLFEDAVSARVGSGNVCLAVAYKDSFSTQALQGHIPCLLYPGGGLPEDCLGICLGSGQSFGAMLLYPVKKLDVVDISSEIVDISLRHFAPYNHGLGSDGRVRFHLDDGRHFVERAASESYDVVSMEPPPPTADGVYSLYSVEFYTEIARVLRRGGLFMQWLPLYRVTPLDAKGIVKTQASVFPETFVVKVGYDDFMVVSYKSRPKWILDRIRERVKVLETERHMKGLRWNRGSKHDLASLEGVLALIVMGPPGVAALEAPVPYRDDDQLLSYSSGDRWILRRYEGPVLSNVSFSALRPTDFSKLGDYFDPPLDERMAADLGSERAAALANFFVPDPQALARELSAPQGTNPAEVLRRSMTLALACDGPLWKDEAYKFLGDAMQVTVLRPDVVQEEHLAAARRIVRNRLAVFDEAAERWMRVFEGPFGDSQILSAMKDELAAYRTRERERTRGYWFSGSGRGR